MPDPICQPEIARQRSRADPRRDSGRVGVMLALVLGPVLLAVGCNEQKHYRMLSFFFDGVPVPEHMREELGLTEGGGAGRTRMLVEQTPVFYHEPYQTRECFGCHDRDQAFEAITTDSRSCQGCHESYFQILPGDWVHGPVAMGMCGHCHQPHKSEHQGLLTAAQPDICFQCHEQDLVKADVFHSRLEDLTCSRCHDPHAAGNRRLLADSRTFRRSTRTDSASKHPVWKHDECGKCHDENQSNVLQANVQRVCLECHEQVRDTSSGVALHGALVEGQCTMCHTAHQSTRPHLIHDTAEQICFTCHTFDQVQTPKHPPIVRGDCLACHTGHHSRREKLLRPGVYGPEPLIPDQPPVPIPRPTTPTRPDQADLAPEPAGQGGTP